MKLLRGQNGCFHWMGDISISNLSTNLTNLFNIDDIFLGANVSAIVSTNLMNWGLFLLVNGTHNASDLTNDRTTVDTLDGLFFWGATNGKTGD